MRGRTTVCELLVDRGANLDLQNTVTTHHIHMSNINEFLFVCCYYEINECLSFIITQRGETALIKAAYYGQTTTCELLVDRGANLDLQSTVTTHHIHMSKWK